MALQTSFADVEVQREQADEDSGDDEDGLGGHLEAVLLVAVGTTPTKAQWQQRKVALSSSVACSSQLDTCMAPFPRRHWKQWKLDDRG